MKKLLSLAAALVFMLVMTAGYAQQTRQLHLRIDFDANIVMARYDVEVLLNGEKVAIIEHGEKLDAVFPVQEGLCWITFQKVGVPEIFGTTAISIVKDADFECEIHANLEDIELRDIVTNAEEADLRLLMGETAPIDGLHVTLTEYRTETSIGTSRAAKGKIFVVCTMEFHNQTGEDVTVSSPFCFDGACDNYELDCKYSTMINQESVLTLIESIGSNIEVIRPGNRLVVEAVFEVPLDWHELEVFYRRSLLSAEELTFVVQND